ncbi:Putative serine/threonine-protein kinase, active [Colletotrichum destructivum]|uniref:Serine/threonine-protein kinase, active n=1 Tax=Colletotrichum destructivum TaxID=34406 RepID=A0AAX4IBC8_9PEZI|nr:Putative serine/threonine-protein kinase, active [Colletotrichum destructivum]
MAPLLSVGQTLRGRISTYSIVQELHRATDQGAVYLGAYICFYFFTPTVQERANVLSIEQTIMDQNASSRAFGATDVLKTRPLAMSPLFRPLEDGILDPVDPPSIVLKYLDSDLRAESHHQRLSRPDIKKVAKSVLEAPRILHQDGLVHTDIKLDNIFVNLGQKNGNSERFTAIQLGDCDGAVSKESKFASEPGHLIGASFTGSPEVQLGLPWGTITDIWSFGNAGYKPEDELYELVVLSRMHRYFGPFPKPFQEIADDNAAGIVDFIHSMGPPTKPFARVTRWEIPPADRDFILKIMKLDYRNRPTTEQLLEDEWFGESSEDTREPLSSV